MGLVLKKRRSKKQKIWEYMRRNRQFRVGELMMILDISHTYLMPMFKVFELAGYLQLKSGAEVFRDRVYQLNKDTGIHSPIILKRPCDTLKDLNTNKEFMLDGNHPVQKLDKLTLLYAMKEGKMYKEQIADVAKMHPLSSKIFRYFDEFIADGVLKKTNRLQNRRKFIIDMEKRDELIRTLEKGM